MGRPPGRGNRGYVLVPASPVLPASGPFSVTSNSGGITDGAPPPPLGRGHRMSGSAYAASRAAPSQPGAEATTARQVGTPLLPSGSVAQ